MHRTTVESRDGNRANYGSLDEKFNHVLSALLSDEDSDKLNDETSLPPSAQKLLASVERNVEKDSAETPDYSADFNSESEKIGNMQEKLDKNDSRYIILVVEDVCSYYFLCSFPVEELEDEEEGNIEIDSDVEKFDTSRLQGNSVVTVSPLSFTSILCELSSCNR